MSARPSQLAEYGIKGLAPIREELRSEERGTRKHFRADSYD
jgi:hypothetical protein